MLSAISRRQNVVYVTRHFGLTSSTAGRILSTILDDCSEIRKGFLMPRQVSRYPTELELQILKALWRQSPMLAREVQAALADFALRFWLRRVPPPFVKGSSFKECCLIFLPAL
jgi:hypothetical protein